MNGVDCLSQFNPVKLSVQYRNGITAMHPIIPRRYTLTHSDDTGELFLTIGSEYAWDKVNFQMKDEVLAEWCMYGNLYFYVFYISSKIRSTKLDQTR